MKSFVALLICLMSLTVAAQQPPAAPARPAVPAAPAAPAPPAPPPADPEVGGQPTNIRLDVIVTDQAANGVPQPKTMMVMLVDRAMGRTRAAFQDRSISVDARPVIVDGRVRVNVTIVSDVARGYGPEPDPKEPAVNINWRNGFSLLLENGKPMLALETMDAVTKRKMSIEVKATIQK